MSLCKGCGTEISQTRANRKAMFCSNRCRTAHYKQQIGTLGSGLPSGTTGAIGELVVAIDLLRRGYEVFRALSPSCSCDLAIIRDRNLVRVEVRTAYLNKLTGSILRNGVDSAKHDLLALVIVNDGSRILYEPELPHRHRIDR
jgi:hypothetical protein